MEIVEGAEASFPVAPPAPKNALAGKSGNQHYAKKTQNPKKNG